jgi:Ca2+-binding RTX toxin-like protein
MTTFTGTGGGDIADAPTPLLSGFTGGTLAQLTDLTGDLFYGLGGMDGIISGGGNDTIYGGASNDTITGGAGFDVMDAGSGTLDAVYLDVGYTNVVFDMATGITNLSPQGESARNFEFARTGNGNDSITGTAAYNEIFTRGGNDVLDGRGGGDDLRGGEGNDKLIGGAGPDAFVFDTHLDATTNVDSVANFNSVEDTFYMDHAVLLTVAVGALLTSAFRLGSSAADATDRIIYNSATGDLSYDPDGIGGVSQKKFAYVPPGTAINASDFVIF